MTEWFEADRTILIWLTLRVQPSTEASVVRALEWLAHNLDRRKVPQPRTASTMEPPVP